ncbi:MAG: ribosome biogenesis GTP-binding protein YihA/YsxC [Oscillospiraceae bacterium]|nr:ribosome biogenesis GTP-binding protein YihA/YsxC [Oscillospiraceae bacterium]
MNFHNIQFETSFGFREQLPFSDMPEIAFCGRSNVGKSSTINKIFNRKQLARVSSMPGKTVTINFFTLEGVRFADLPGYGYAKVSKSEKARWGDLMEAYFTSGRNLRLVFLLIDIRHPPSKDDLIMLDFLRESGYDFTIILTKADKLSKTKQQERLSAFLEEIPDAAGLRLTPFSARNGQGLSEVHAIIEQAAIEQE